MYPCRSSFSLRQQDSSNGVILGGITKEVGFVGCHGLNHLLADLGIALGKEQGTQLIDGPEAELLNDGREAAFKQIMLVIFEHNSHMGIDVLLKEPIVLGENLRDGSVWLAMPLPLNSLP